MEVSEPLILVPLLPSFPAQFGQLYNHTAASVLCTMLPGLGDLHLANTDEEEQEQLSSDSGHEQVASKWDRSVVSLAPFDEGAFLYTCQVSFLHVYI
jgi:hypothetical protein